MKQLRYLSMVLVLLVAVLINVVSVSATDKVYRYEERVKELFFEKYSYIPEEKWNVYNENYEYSSSDGTVPDYVLLSVYVASGEMDCVQIIGDYVLVCDYTYFPNESLHFVYVPSKDTLYTFPELYSADIKIFEKIFENRGYGLELIGDADQDRKITIKDATWIQKKLAGFSMSTDYGEDTVVLKERYVQDFNRDTVVNIQDATAIQKYLAGITGTYAESPKAPVDNPFSSQIQQDSDFDDECIIVSPKYTWGHDYTLEDFPEYEFSSIEKIGGTDGKGYAIYVLYLENPGKENVVEAIKALDYRAETDLYAAEPNYIFYIEEWI